ncbi:MAG: GNAT family N-acetyltransferase [Firmicutes bacterium]|nr:GNAT family N-acetyltransferase [Bacillota bacterium]
MKLVLCRNGQEFVDQFKPVLLAHEVVYQLIMGNALANADVPCEPECFFGAVMDESDRPVLLFGHRAPYRLLIHSLDTTTIDEAVPLLVSYVVENQIDIAGVLASDAICSAFTAYDSAHTYARRISMDIMELRELRDISLAPGYFRQATEADLDLICRWHVEFNAEATGHPIEYATSYEKNSKRLSDFYLFEDSSGQIVAMACIARKLLKGCCVSLVYTDPAQRGKGYCAALMHHLAKMQLATGYEYVGLFVDQANPISNHTYKKVGYVILEDSIEYDRIISE